MTATKTINATHNKHHVHSDAPSVLPSSPFVYISFTHDTHNTIQPNFWCLPAPTTCNNTTTTTQQGQLGVSADGQAFTQATVGTNETVSWGCCQRKALMRVELATGKWSLTGLHNNSKGVIVEGVDCGKYGCGFLETGHFDAKTGKAMVWVEKELPQPPPSSADPLDPPSSSSRRAAPVRSHPRTRMDPAAPPAAAADPPALTGMAIASFDLATGGAAAVRPFRINDGNPTGPTVFNSGMSSFDDQGRLWFPCLPESQNDDVEGVCSVPATPSATNAAADIQVYSSDGAVGKTLTTTDMQYSKALKSAVVVVQGIAPETKSTEPVPTSVWTAGPKGFKKLVDLGAWIGWLHQTTISSDGRHLMFTGTKPTSGETYPTSTLLTVDLVAKKVVTSIVMQDSQKITVLATLPC